MTTGHWHAELNTHADWSLDDSVYRRFFEAAPYPMLIHSASGRAYAVNDALCELMGSTKHELCAMAPEDVLVPGDAAIRDLEAEQNFEGQGGGAAVHRRMIRKDGTVIRTRARKIVIRAGRDPLILTILEPWSDIGELEHVAQHDELTGLLNRRGFRAQVEVTFTAMPTVLAMVDIDRLKEANDRYGHHAGDSLLQRVAETLTDVVPSGALVGRWSGDEFVVAAARAAHCPDPTVLAAVIRSGFDAADDVVVGPHGESLRPTVSVGVSEYDARIHVLDKALAIADRHMYVDKAVVDKRPGRRARRVRSRAVRRPRALWRG